MTPPPEDQKIIVRYGEIFLKGRNQIHFEKILMGNVKSQTGITSIHRGRGRLILPYFKDHHKLRHIFGITSYSVVHKTLLNLDHIQETAFSMLKSRTGTFKIQTTRSNKQFPLTSLDVNKRVGQYIEEKTNLRCDLYHPDIMIEIELQQNAAYLFCGRISCAGGIPTGVDGPVVVFIENSAGILAGLLFMKRGSSILPLCKNSLQDISLLEQFSPHKLTPQIVSTISEVETFSNLSSVIVSGQTVKNYKLFPTSMLVFRPLISYSDSRIRQELQHFSSLHI